MSLSPSSGIEGCWRGLDGLWRGQRWAFSETDAAFKTRFCEGKITTALGKARFHVALPAMACGYFVTCAGTAVVYVPPLCSASAEVAYDRVQARRWPATVYTTLGCAAARRPAWATGKYATRWWDTSKRRLQQPLQDAILATGQQSTCVYMVKVLVPRAAVWIAIWRVSGGLYSYDMLQTLHHSGEATMTALARDLNLQCPELRLDANYVYYGLEPNPAPQFPRTEVASLGTISGNARRVQPSPLTKLPKFVSKSGEVHWCPDSPGSVPTVNFVPQVAKISVRLPARLAGSKQWRFCLGLSSSHQTERQDAKIVRNRVQCAVWTKTWANMAGLGSAPWLTLYLEAKELRAAIPVPRLLLSDLASGRGWGCDDTRQLKPSVLLTREEFVALGQPTAVRVVVAAAIEHRRVALPNLGTITRSPPVTGPRRRGIAAGAAQIAGTKTVREALAAFHAVESPTRRHVEATLLRLLVLPEAPNSGPDWSAFLAACARRLKKMQPTHVRALVRLLMRVEAGDGGMLVHVIGALEQWGYAVEAKRLKSAVNIGALCYVCMIEGLPTEIVAACAKRGRVLEPGALGVFMRLIATEPGDFQMCPAWKTGVTMPMYTRGSGADIYAKASSAAAAAVDAAVPSQRKRVAAANGVLCYVQTMLELTSGPKVRFTDALKTASV